MAEAGDFVAVGRLAQYVINLMYGREVFTGRHSVSLLWVLVHCAASSFEVPSPLSLHHLSLLFLILGPRDRLVRRGI